jgi:hypothetical protein
MLRPGGFPCGEFGDIAKMTDLAVSQMVSLLELPKCISDPKALRFSVFADDVRRR